MIIDKSVIEGSFIQTEEHSNNITSQSSQIDEEEEDPLKPQLPADNISSLVSPSGSTFDYLYEFSETRKVLEEFFKCPLPTKEKENNTESFPFQVSTIKNLPIQTIYRRLFCSKDLDYELKRQGGSSYVGHRLATGPPTVEEVLVHESPKKQKIDFPPEVSGRVYLGGKKKH